MSSNNPTMNSTRRRNNTDSTEEDDDATHENAKCTNDMTDVESKPKSRLMTAASNIHHSAIYSQEQQGSDDDNWSVSTSNYSIVSGMTDISKASKNSAYTALSNFSRMTMPGQASRKHKSLASSLAALVVLVICAFAMRSCGDEVVGHMASGSGGTANRGGENVHVGGDSFQGGAINNGDGNGRGLRKNNNLENSLNRKEGGKIVGRFEEVNKMVLKDSPVKEHDFLDGESKEKMVKLTVNETSASGEKVSVPMFQLEKTKQNQKSRKMTTGRQQQTLNKNAMNNNNIKKRSDPESGKPTTLKRRLQDGAFKDLLEMPLPSQLQKEQQNKKQQQQQTQQQKRTEKPKRKTTRNPFKRFRNPVTIKTRSEAPLDLSSYQINALLRPDGYPWHRWVKPIDGSYPLNTIKFVEILARLGRGENKLGTVTPQEYTWGGVPIDGDTIRMPQEVRPFIIRDGTVLRPDSSSGMFVTFVQMALEKAKMLADQDPRMRLVAEADLPIIFDANDYPWCGEDYVPVFRLNAIKSMNCMHSWPTFSLTYFGDPNNVQMYTTPYEWDEQMEKWDATYPWESKLDQVVWRGRLTGYTYPDEEKPRLKLVQYAEKHSDIMDVQAASQRNKMPQDDFMKYKAILDIDGNAWSARLGKLLCYNSVVVKVEPEYVGYWEKELHPWVHYIPVKPDLSDFENVIRYVLAPENAEQMQQIIKNAQNFCRTKLTFEQYTVDLLWTLWAYAKLLTESPDFMEVWMNNHDAYLMPALNMGVRKSYTLPF